MGLRKEMIEDNGRLSGVAFANPLSMGMFEYALCISSPPA